MATLEQRVTRLEEEMVTKDFLAKKLDGLEDRLLTELRTEFRRESRAQTDRVLEALSSGNNPNY